MTIWKLSLRLVREQGLLLSVAVATTLIAATIAVGIPLYLGGIETATLEHEFARLSQAQVNGWVTAGDVPFNRAAFESIGNEVRDATSVLGETGAGTGSVVRSAPFSISIENDDRFVPFSSVYLQAMIGGGAPLRLISGVLPEAGLPGIAIPLTVALSTTASVGDRLVLDVRGNQGPIELLVTGIFEPEDTSDAYWAGISNELLSPVNLAPGASGNRSAFVGLIDETLLFDITPGISSTLGTGWWLVSVDTPSIIRDGLAATSGRIDQFTQLADAVAPGARAFLGAEAPLAKLKRDRSAQVVPVVISAVLLLLVAGQVVLLAASVMTASTRGSTSRLGLRGGGTAELLGFSSLSALIVLVVPALIGPPLAWLVVPTLGAADALRPLTGGASLLVQPGVASFGISAAVGLTAALLVLLPGVDLAPKRRPARSSTGHGERPPLIWRMKLDLLIVAVSALAIWEMDARGLLSPGTGSGDLSALRVMLPTAFVTVAAILALVRFWAVAPGIGAGAAGTISPAVWYAINSMLRSSFRHAWLVTLVAIATITAVTNSTIAATLEANGRFAAAQAAGGDARIAGLNGFRGESNPAVLKITGEPAVADWAPALRTVAALGANGGGAGFDLLAVDPNALGPILVDDSMKQSAFDAGDMLLQAAGPTSPESITLPAGTESVRISGRLSEEFIDIWIRIRGAGGATSTVLMSPDDRQGPTAQDRVYSGDLSDLPTGPFELLSILVYEPPVGPVGHAVTLAIDRFEVYSGPAQAQAIPKPGGPSKWSVLPGTAEIDGSVVGATGGTGQWLTVNFGPGTDGGIRGVHLRDDLDYLPVVMSPGLQESSGLDEGDTGFITAFGQVVPVRFAGAVDAFATLGPSRPFAVVDYQAILDYLSLKVDPVLPGMAELFVSAAPGPATDIRSIARNAGGADTRVFAYQQLVDESTASAGASAGWKGTNFVVTVALLVLTGVGLVLFIGHDLVENRRPSSILSILGVSRSGLAIETTFRVGLVTLVGIAAGAVLGSLLGSFVATRITDSYTVRLTDPAHRAATFDVAAVAYVAVLLVIGLAALSGLILLRPVQRIADRQGGIG